MDVGMAAIFQNPHGARSDLEVYQNDLRLAELAEPLGFDSVWGVEHHFTDYTMCPDVLQFLAYMAGKTTRIKLGSMVVVLPWHDPLRVAEEISMLDNMSNGRMILGMGRGAGKVEFDGFRLDMGESRERFVESAEMVLEGLERGYVEYEGKFIHQPRVDIRPRPFKSFRNRTYAAAVSPESSQIMAKLGVGILIIPQKPWPAVVEELEAYRQTYRQVNAGEAPPTILGGWTFCDEDEGRAYEGARKYIGGYWQTVLDHYRFHEGHLKQVKGYEYYGKFADQIQKSGLDAAVDFFMSIQVWGTPEQCYEKILKAANKTGADSFNAVFSYAGMPWDVAEKSQRLFAKAVLPELKKIGPASERLLQAAE